ncbi:MAG: 16S rRNA (uracil(1498)-N(3))-methyltransferase [Proteobacteria bacterium]|nr:16S rRNA (uracil(1498)-N(3))-methyltransferase [Pseudomonadota bacterium]MBU1739628.1 16S rRNA (uracil(1498)-N(3))-methyltransferase [Pseudomonadota bacterium]
MRRFFIAPSEIHDSEGIIRGEEARHILQVLRLKPGKKIALFDGTGNIYDADITSTTKKEVLVTISSSLKETERPPFLHLGMALLTGKKMELVVQKATELGVKTIQPFISRYNTAQEITGNKGQRLQKISAEACKQCGRPVPPVIKPLLNFDQLIADPENSGFKIIFYEDENKVGLRDIETNLSAARPDSVLFLTGPEGGFTPDEVELARQHGYTSSSLGTLVMRAETAAISGAALLQYLLGNLNPVKH